MRSKELSKTPWAIESRNRYRDDPIYRESQKDKSKKRYVKREKFDRFNIAEKVYITSKAFMDITGLPRGLFYRLKKDGIITPCKQMKSSRKLLFNESDAYMFRDFLNNFLINPHLITFEKYDKRKLKEFMRSNIGTYNHITKRFIDPEPVTN